MEEQYAVRWNRNAQSVGDRFTGIKVGKGLVEGGLQPPGHNWQPLYTQGGITYYGWAKSWERQQQEHWERYHRRINRGFGVATYFLLWLLIALAYENFARLSVEGAATACFVYLGIGFCWAMWHVMKLFFEYGTEIAGDFADWLSGEE